MDPKQRLKQALKDLKSAQAQVASAEMELENAVRAVKLHALEQTLKTAGIKRIGAASALLVAINRPGKSRENFYAQWAKMGLPVGACPAFKRMRDIEKALGLP